jgi:hypothetical protein
MMTMNKSNVVLVIVVVAAIAVASVVAVHGHGGATSALSAAGAENPSMAGLADTSTVASSTGSGASAVDPAKQDPTLDQFHSRDPFIQTTAAPVASPTPSSSSTASASPKPVAADVKIVKTVTKTNATHVYATYVEQKVGAKVPQPSPVFEIAKIEAGGVTFTETPGFTVGGTQTPFKVVPGTSQVVEIQNPDGTDVVDYSISVTLDYTSKSSSPSSSAVSSDTGGSASSVAGHNITALSIENSNGVPSATLVVDGTTYAAERIGKVITTSWGQIKILGINGPAQTVTVLHADVQVTLRVGQSVSK